MPEGNLGQLTASLGADLKDLRNSMNRAEKMIRDYERTTDRGLDKSEARWKRYGRSVERYAKGVKSSIMSVRGALAGMAGALVIGDTIRKGAQFEQTITRVGAVSNATKEEFMALSNTAKELGETTEFSATQAADGLQFLSMAGFEAVESINALPGVLDLATAGSIDLGRAADIASNVLTSMQMEVSELSTVNDTFVKSTTSANINMEMLAESFKYAGSIGAAFGYDVQEITGYIGQLGNAGIQGSMAGTQLAMAFQQAGKVFEEYGIDAERSEKYTNDLMGALELLEDRGAGAAEIMDIFGQRAGRGVAALLGVGSDAIQEYTQDLKDAEGATQDIANQFRSTTIGRFRELKSAIESVQIDLFEQQSGALNRTLQDLTGYVRENKDEFIELTNSMIDTAKAFKPIITGVGSFIGDVMSGWAQAPDIIKSLGFVGALLFGKKGVAAITAVGALGKNIGQGLARAIYGELDVEDRLEKQADEIRKEIALLEKDFGEIDTLDFSPDMKGMEEFQEYVQLVQPLKEELEQVENTLKFMRQEEEKSTKTMQKFQGSTDKVTKALAEFDKATEKANESSKRLQFDLPEMPEMPEPPNTPEILELITSRTTGSIKTEELQTWANGAKNAFEQYSSAAQNAAENTQNLFSNAFQGAENALVNFVTTGKASFSDLINSIVADLARLTIRQAITGPLAQGLSGMFSGGQTTTTYYPTISTGIDHTGGIVGSEQNSRSVSSSVFSNAPRFHDGGIVGDEVPIIAKKKEGIFTPEQMEAMGSNIVKVQVIDNRTSSDSEQVQVERSTENGQHVIRAIVNDTFRGGLKTGKFDQSFRGSFGVKRQPIKR